MLSAIFLFDCFVERDIFYSRKNRIIRSTDKSKLLALLEARGKMLEVRNILPDLAQNHRSCGLPRSKKQEVVTSAFVRNNVAASAAQERTTAQHSSLSPQPCSPKKFSLAFCALEVYSASYLSDGAVCGSGIL